MVAADIFVRARNESAALEAFVQRAVTALGLTGLQERESSNYRDGRYFLATLGGAKVELSYLDTVGLEEWQFLVTLEPAKPAEAKTAAESLAKAGFKCFIPEGAWYRKEWSHKGVSYGL
jgi:hypothetical protein